MLSLGANSLIEVILFFLIFRRLDVNAMETNNGPLSGSESDGFHISARVVTVQGTDGNK